MKQNPLEAVIPRDVLAELFEREARRLRHVDAEHADNPLVRCRLCTGVKHRDDR